jgi:hypothetical protein
MLRPECVVVNVLDVVSIEEDARDFQETMQGIFKRQRVPSTRIFAQKGTLRANMNVSKFWPA